MPSIERFAQKKGSKQRLVPDRWNSFLKLVEVIKEAKDEDFQVKEFGSPEIIAALNSYGTGFYDALYTINRFKPVNYIHPEEEIKKDLLEIKRVSRDFLLESDSIGFTTNNIVMYDGFNDASFDFGNFTITMYRDGAVVSKYDKNKTNDDGYYHPYVSQHGDLCLGEASEPYKTAFRESRFYDCYILIMNCLTNYSGDTMLGRQEGPHRSLSMWLGVRCEICDGLHDPAYGITCAKTNLHICETCSTQKENVDEITGKVYLPQFIEYCENCKQNTIGVINDRCVNCRVNKIPKKETE